MISKSVTQLSVGGQEGAMSMHLGDIEDLVKEDRVHRRVYTDPSLFEEEIRRIFHRVWTFVGHESEAPHPGDYKTVYLGGQPVLMSRHEDGKIYVMYNRCMHRGPVVCREESGNSNLFRCMYHGWTYRNDGSLAGVPFSSGYPPGFDLNGLGLMRLPRVGSYRGFVFASLSPEGESLEEFLAPVRSYIDKILDRAPDGEIEVRCGVQKYEYCGNWKLQFENFIDHYHAPFTHESAFVSGVGEEIYRKRFLSQEVRDAVEVRAFKYGHSILDHPHGAGSGKEPEAFRSALEKSRGKERAEAILSGDLHVNVFPTLLFQEHSQSYRIIRPIGVDRTEVFVYPYRLKGAPEEFNDAMVRGVSYWAAATGTGQPDDLEAMTRAQLGLQAEGPEWVIFARGIHHEKVGPLGERISGKGTDETGIRGLHRYWKELMLRSDGRPEKRS